MPRSHAARDQGADPLPRRGGTRARARLPRRGARDRLRRASARSAPRHNRRVAIEFSERIRRIPVYPAAGGYAAGAARPLVRLASNESPFAPLPAVREAIERRLATLNRYPDPSNSLLRRRLSERYEVPARADRDRQRLLRHPARRRRGAARARRGARLRVAVVLGLPAPRRRLRRARGRPCRSTASERHDLRRDAARDHRRHAPGDRLQPQQPDEHRPAARGHRASSSPRCRRTCA